MQNQYRNHEDAMADAIGNAIMGGKLSFYRGLSMFFTKLMAANGLVILRQHFGTYFISLSTLFWCSLFNGLMLFIAGGSRIGFIMVAIHSAYFLVAGIWHIIEAKRNLWKADPNTARHSMFWGSSLLWPLYIRVILWLKLQNSFLGRMNPFQFQKWMEPLGLVIPGVIFFMLGLYPYGIILSFAGMSIFRIALQIEKDFYDTVQRGVDANERSGMLSESPQSSRPLPASNVVTRVGRRV